ncbi:hypothetical protein ACU8KH_05489 [Lachancea thermotolerans]
MDFQIKYLYLEESQNFYSSEKSSIHQSILFTKVTSKYNSIEASLELYPLIKPPGFLHVPRELMRFYYEVKVAPMASSCRMTHWYL